MRAGHRHGIAVRILRGDFEVDDRASAARRLFDDHLGGTDQRRPVDRRRNDFQYGADDGTRRPAPAGKGMGLAGMRERVAAHGGSFTAGPCPAGGFAVVATLPYGSAS